MARTIQRIGEFLKIDEEGYFINDSKTPILLPWSLVVNETRDAYIHHLQNRIHSIYIRGSVARGTAIENVSDVDSFAVVFGGSREISTAWFDEFKRLMIAKYPFTKVDMRCINHRAVMLPDRLNFLKFIIKTQSICIHGKDLASELPRYKPSLQVVWHLYRIEDNLKTVKVRLEAASTSEEIETQCQWIMKRIVRCGGELFIEEELAYSRDLFPCYELFSEHYPAQASEMMRALQLAVNPSSDKQEVLEFLDNFGPWLCEKSRWKRYDQSKV